MITKRSQRCSPCVNKKKKQDAIINGNRPSLTQLQEDIKTLNNYVQVGKKYNVSDNTIRKWLDEL